MASSKRSHDAMYTPLHKVVESSSCVVWSIMSTEQESHEVYLIPATLFGEKCNLPPVEEFIDIVSPKAEADNAVRYWQDRLNSAPFRGLGVVNYPPEELAGTAFRKADYTVYSFLH